MAPRLHQGVSRMKGRLGFGTIFSLGMQPDIDFTYLQVRTSLNAIALSPNIALESCRLPGNFHNDPADRIIVATCRVHKIKFGQGSDHGNLLLTHYIASIRIPCMMLRIHFLGVKTAL